jgi:hypothetical protein
MKISKKDLFIAAQLDRFAWLLFRMTSPIHKLALKCRDQSDKLTGNDIPF